VDGCYLLQVFEQHCTNGWDDDRGAWRSCFSDEHYFATVLATQGLDEVSQLHCPSPCLHSKEYRPQRSGLTISRQISKLVRANRVGHILASVRLISDSGCHLEADSLSSFTLYF
jgi:hypothetical protein